ncbi:MAG: OmpH family outer membrane protein [Gemmatimonadaceae bacterium]|nr:OmpH family outer membrane protein [Gemmatimonadaceae bacterium]
MNVGSRGLVAALVLLVASAAPAAAQSKVGYVDSRKILQEMPGRNQVEAKLRTDLESLQQREKKMIDSLNVMMGAFEKDSAKLSTEDRTKRFTALQQYDAMYRDTLQALQEEAQGKQAEAMQPLFDIIRIALEDVRSAEGYSMIFDLGAQVNPIVAMDKNLDLSDKVIARIRTMPAARPTVAPAPKPAAPAAKPSGPVSQPAGVTRKP